MLKSMELDGEEQADMAMPMPVDAPEYPYGLRVVLSDVEMEKLGIDPSEAQVGGSFMLNALCRITSVSMNQTDAGDCFRMEVQIEEAEVPGQDDATEAPAVGKIAYKSMGA